MASYPRMLEEATQFVLACYSMLGKSSLTDARVETWTNKMRRCTLESPKLSSLPPTSAAFNQNALRAHFQLAVWLNALEARPPLLNPTDHGWSQLEGSTFLTPTIIPDDIPLAPSELLKVIKCGCDSSTPCSTKRCGCKSQAVSCTLFCLCKGGDACMNTY